MVGRRASAYGGPVGGLHGCAAEPMVGRNRELARVAALLDDALAGRGRLVLCTGEAGIGKTRLAEEAAASAAAVGVAVAWARAADRNSSPPYGLWRLVLDEPAIRTGDGASSRPDLWAQVFGDAERPAPAEGAIEFLAARFEPFRGQHVANGAGAGVYKGPVELPLGRAAAALGRLDAAVADLEAAVTVCDANGARGCAVQARVELAAALARRQAPGDQDRARAALDAAAGEAGRLGMVPFTEQIEQLRARQPAAAAGGSPLSPRELEVARLVAQGMTNKQIGRALYVSERTAENHVQHILTKLGLRNRSQIAAWSSAGEAAAG